MKYLVSSCLLGKNCKYNGGNNLCPKLVEFLKDKDYIDCCPECLGGLSTPRIPSEINGNRVVNENNIDVTKEYNLGAEKALERAKENNCDCAILKSKSPSCGYGKIYDGTFSKTLIPGNGITTNLLIENNIKIISSDDPIFLDK